MTIVIDTGLPTRQFTDLVESHGDLIDFVKFGWGTALVTSQIATKIAALRANGVNFYFGGTLFEKHYFQGRLDDFRRFLSEHQAEWVEISNGTADISEEVKCGLIAEFRDGFNVISEVGSKIDAVSEVMAPHKWIEAIRNDLAAGASYVTLETRESGKGGICRTNGELRYGLIEEILDAGFAPETLIFEAPTSQLQTYFVERVGSNVNVGNIASDDVVSLETLRRGLRSDTFFTFEENKEAVSRA